MKKIITGLSIVLMISFCACKKSEFAKDYVNPATVANALIERQFAGTIASNLDYVMYKYWNYFVVLQNTALPWSQAVGVANTPGRYVPGAAAISDRWGNYYNFLAQYKELLNVYAKSTAAEQKDKRIFIIMATIYFYDHSQKVVDLHGDIPWSQAGLLSTNNGNVGASYAKYDAATDIYTKMLDDLKGFADELNTIAIPSALNTLIATQDFLNNGDLTRWKKYCNSLRLRILTRASGVTAFQSRANTEIAAILANPSSYPLISSNADNIAFKVFDQTSSVSNGSSTGTNASFYTGLIGWGGGDVPTKPMVDFLKNNADPRLRAMFQPGASAAGNYAGLDPLMSSTDQTNLVNGGTLSRYNFSTISQNLNVPGLLIGAPEVSFMLAEYYLNSGNDVSAKNAYETGVKQSIDYYYWLRSISNSNVSPALTPTNDAEKAACLTSPGVNWTLATTKDAKLNLIATQKWINYSVLEPLENWAEVRRLKLPALTFLPDNTNPQKMPPSRWSYPTNESTYNAENYAAVKAKDQITTKIFWDVK